MLLVDLNYNIECDWFDELSDNKLSDNNLARASELVGHRVFFKPITIEEIVIFMINVVIIRVLPFPISVRHSCSPNFSFFTTILFYKDNDLLKLSAPYP